MSIMHFLQIQFFFTLFCKFMGYILNFIPSSSSLLQSIHNIYELSESYIRFIEQISCDLLKGTKQILLLYSHITELIAT